MCVNGRCQNAFACTPFVNAIWKTPNDLLAGGAFDEARNPEFMQLVPLAGIGVRKQYALRIFGGPTGEHSFERVVLKYFNPIRKVWGGSILVNLSKTIEEENNSVPGIALLGGYTSKLWPASGTGNWWRDFVAGPLHVVSPIPSPRAFGVSAYWHNATYPALIPALAPPDAVNGWPDRFIKLEWYITPSYNVFARIDGREWVPVTSVNQDAPDAWHQFRGFAAGWVSSYSGGSIDIKEVKLYDNSCLPSPIPTRTRTPTPTPTITPTGSPTPI